MTQGIVSLICTVFLMGNFRNLTVQEFVGWIVIGSCHRILGKTEFKQSSNIIQ